MKVWFPLTRGDSGSDVFTTRLASALRERGIEAELGWFPGRLEAFPYPLRGVAPPAGTNIVHANSWNGFAFHRTSLPLVVTCHLDIHSEVFRPYRSLGQSLYHDFVVSRYERNSFRAASAITAVSASTKNAIENAYSLPRSSVRHIPTWVDATRFIPPPTASASWPAERPFRLLFVGNPTARKGADMLGPIMRGLGDGFELHYTSGLRDNVLGRVASNMKPIGRIADSARLVDMYHSCDALLFPSRLEGFSLVVLEAMACSVPVIAAAIPSVLEAIENHVTGFLCPPNDIGAFISVCRQLRDAPALRQMIGTAARRRVVEAFSEERIVSKYVALYEELLGSGYRA